MHPNRINIDPIRPMIRHAVDMAVLGSVARFRADLGDQERFVHKIAHAAAQAAVDTLAAHFSHELRMIEIDYERRANDLLRDARPIIFDPTKPPEAFNDKG